MCDEKNGRISRKAEDKVPQNEGLAELCRGRLVDVVVVLGGGLSDEFRRCVRVQGRERVRTGRGGVGGEDGHRGSERALFFPAVPSTPGRPRRPGAL